MESVLTFSSLGRCFTSGVILFNHLITGRWFCLVPVSHFLDEKSTSISFSGFSVGYDRNMIDSGFYVLKVIFFVDKQNVEIRKFWVGRKFAGPKEALLKVGEMRR
ncbi:MAG: hypothetical protein E7F77_08760 [Serratia marcescens]|nr:hypothetical protein [Serratia marcescens]MDU3647482.1 hypothetical protein [Serratia marcescens]